MSDKSDTEPKLTIRNEAKESVIEKIKNLKDNEQFFVTLITDIEKAEYSAETICSFYDLSPGLSTRYLNSVADAIQKVLEIITKKYMSGPPKDKDTVH